MSGDSTVCVHVCVHIVLQSEGRRTIERVNWMPGSSCRSRCISKQQCGFNQGCRLYLAKEDAVAAAMPVMVENGNNRVHTHPVGFIQVIRC